MTHHYSPEAVARKWDISVDTVYRLMNRNELHSFRVGRRRVVLSESVEAFERGGVSDEVVVDRSNVIPFRKTQ